MKKMLMFILVVTVFVMAFSGCSVVKIDKPSGGEKPIQGEKTEKALWKTAFRDFLIELDSKNEKPYGAINFVGLNDLNLDGVPELIVSDDAASAAWSFGIFQLVDEKVEKVWGYSSLVDGGLQQKEDGKIVNFYSVFDEDFLTLCKNEKTGEKAYVMETQNGHSEGSFGSIFLITEEKGRIVPVERFSYEDFIDSVEKEKPDLYFVENQAVSENEYEKKYDEFDDLWDETEYQGYAMVSEHLRGYPKPVKLEITAEALDEFFGLYVPEIK